MAEKDKRPMFGKSIIVNIFLAFVFIALISGLVFVGLSLRGPRRI